MVSLFYKEREVLMKVLDLVKGINDLQSGEKVYINAINLTEAGIIRLRLFIQSGVLIPVREEVELRYKEPEDIMSGKVIFPQMWYEKR